MNEKKVLIVTYYWPPSGGVGVQRWMNYAIQLKRLGWEPIIYTPENPQFELKDASLLEKVKDIRVVKTKIWEPFNFFHRLTGNRNKKSVTQGTVLEKESSSFKDKLFIRIRGNFFIPDPRKFWVKPSIKFLAEFIIAEGIETIITTGPPHSMHLIGRGVKKRTGVRWLADFRDPWSKWDVLKKLKTSPFGMIKHGRLEKSVLTKADGVIAA
ncbi:MAG: glycosyl transferase, partial [Cyclobacteriaceae bacterium]